MPGSAGNIGGLVLRRFRVIFDYPRRRIILEPNATYGEPFEYDMSGLALMEVPPEFRSFRVLRVIAGSPAAELDIRPGDQVETVDGRPLEDFGLEALRDSLRQQGFECRLGLRRGEERREVVLRTRRLI